MFPFLLRLEIIKSFGFISESIDSKHYEKMT